VLTCDVLALQPCEGAAAAAALLLSISAASEQEREFQRRMIKPASALHTVDLLTDCATLQMASIIAAVRGS